MLNKDSILIATDECIMDGEEGTECLTIGKEYPIVELRDGDLIIIDNERTEHAFVLQEDIDSWDKFFIIKQDYEIY